ncbi:hypothetical protein Tsubulata_050563 [Turnera subulata]|uniref:Cystatin domain-containing protein n=1 Tax=Turnera subulata TaxID=218843 RepID=A0A9Q0J2L6_9ROSI|nr:hypothetical protein Tsubulata_050563 [Turnera subulata]
MEERRSERSFDSAVMDSAVDETKKRKHAAEGDDNQAEEEEDISPEAESESKHDESSDTKKGGDKKLSKEELAWRERLGDLYDSATEDMFETEEEKANYRKYIQELSETGGYGITTKFEGIIFGVIVPFNLSGPAKSDIEIMKELCNEAIEEYVPGLEFVDLVHACTVFVLRDQGVSERKTVLTPPSWPRTTIGSENTQGYRMKTRIPGAVFGVILPIDVKKEGNVNTIEFAKKCVRKAIKRKKPGLEFVELLYICVGREDGNVYYITFTARDPSSPEELKTYQFKYRNFTRKIRGFKQSGVSFEIQKDICSD